jgi:hypothetical protein
MLRCCCCQEAKPHFTTVGDMGGYCDECILAGKLKNWGVTVPDYPGIIQPEALRALPLATSAIQ